MIDSFVWNPKMMKTVLTAIISVVVLLFLSSCDQEYQTTNESTEKETISETEINTIEYPSGYSKDTIMDFLKQTYGEKFIDGTYTDHSYYLDGTFYAYYELVINDFRVIGCTMGATIKEGNITETFNDTAAFKQDYDTILSPIISEHDEIEAYNLQLQRLLDRYPEAIVIKYKYVKLYHPDVSKFCCHMLITYELPGEWPVRGGYSDGCYYLD